MEIGDWKFKRVGNGKENRGTNKDSIKSFRVVSRSQSTSILHVRPQIPKLLQSHPTDIHNIIALRNRRTGMISIHQRRAQRHHESY